MAQFQDQIEMDKMMEKNYFIFTPNGWWGSAGTLVSEIKDAKAFTHEEAVEFCKRRYSEYAGFSAVPVAEDDIVRISSR